LGTLSADRMGARRSLVSVELSICALIAAPLNSIR
jgi:hypothetical protein